MKKRSIFGLTLLTFLLGGLSWGAWIYFITTPLAFDKPLKESSRVYDSQGVLLDELHGEEHRTVIKSKDIDPKIKAAVIAIEDANFYKHKGVSIRGVGRAVTKATKDSVKNRKVSVSEGASTIPMQLAKNLNGSVQDRTVSNKITETIQALKLNNSYSKDEILTKYLNVIYWGNNTYGIQTATQTYFGKDASNVEFHEAATLAAMIQNPSAFNPYSSNENSYKNLKARQYAVLSNLSYTYSGCLQTTLSDGSLDVQSYDRCLEEWVDLEHAKPLLFSGARTWKNPTGVSGYIVDLAINELIDLNQFNINSKEDLEHKGLGLNIYSTIDLKNQKIAGDVVAARNGMFGTAQIGVTAVEPDTGKILFSIGGRDYNKSSLNRTTKYGGLKGRQPGSSMKPWVYYTAMGDFKWSPGSTIIDAPYCPRTNYCPKNYGGNFSGVDSVLNHLAKSRNIPAIKLGQYVGIDNVIRNMRKVGYTTKLEAVPSFPLGSNDVYVDQHAAGYAAFANGGYKVEATSLDRIISNKEEVLYSFVPNPIKQLTDRGVKNINQVLRYAATNGTGYPANTISNVHTKTGTTDKEADVWCMAYVPGKISLATWIGNDNYHKKMYGASSVSWACPISGSILSKLNQMGSI